MFQISERLITIQTCDNLYYENVVKVVLGGVRSYSFLFPDLAHCICEPIIVNVEGSNNYFPAVLLERPIPSIKEELLTLEHIEKKLLSQNLNPNHLLFQIDFTTLDEFLDLLESQGQDHPSNQTIVWKFATHINGLRNPNLN